MFHWQDLSTKPHKAHNAWFLRWGIMLILVVLLASCTGTNQALATDFAIDTTRIAASITPDGTLSAEESRTISFEQPEPYYLWSLQSLPGNDLEVSTVTISQNDEDYSLDSQTFYPAWRERASQQANNLGFSLQNRFTYDSATKNLYIFSDHLDGSVTITISYKSAYAADRYSDIAEITWQFADSSEDSLTGQTTLTLTLPIPESSQRLTGSDYLFAWIHGPSGSTIVSDPDAGTITASLPPLKGSQSASLHAVFPGSWLSGVMGTDPNMHPNTYRYEATLWEEQRWSDQAYANRLHGLVDLGLCLLLILGSLIWALVTFLRFINRSKELSITPDGGRIFASYWEVHRFAVIGMIGVILIIGLTLSLLWDQTLFGWPALAALGTSLIIGVSSYWIAPLASAHTDS